MAFTTSQITTALGEDDSLTEFSLEKFKREDTTNIFEDILITGAAAVSSLANTGVAVGNFVGGDIEEVSPTSFLSNDLGDEFVKSKESFNLAGDIVGGFVPGLGAIKVLRSVKAGTGRLSSLYRVNNFHQKEKKILSRARKSITDNPLAPDLRNVKKDLFKNSLKVGAIEGAAFELAAYAGTTLKTDLSDSELEGFDVLLKTGKHVLFGAAFGGLAEGIINPLIHSRALVNFSSQQAKGSKALVVSTADGLEAGSRIGFISSELENIAKQTDLPKIAAANVVDELKIVRTRAVTDILGNKDDTVLQKALIDFVGNSDNKTVNSALTHVRQVNRLTDKATFRPLPKNIEDDMAKFTDQFEDLLPGARNGIIEIKDALATLPRADRIAFKTLNKFLNDKEINAFIDNTAIVSLRDGAIHTEFSSLHLGDYNLSEVRKGSEITVDGSTVRLGDKTKTPLQAQAKFLIAKELYLPDEGIGKKFGQIKDNDIPTLEAAYHHLTGISTTKKEPIFLDRGVLPVTSNQLKDMILKAKEEGILKLLDNKPETTLDEAAAIFNVDVSALENLSWKNKNLDQWLPLQITDYREVRTVQVRTEATKFSYDRDLAVHYAKQEVELLVANAKDQAELVLGRRFDLELDELSLLNPAETGSSLIKSATSSGAFNSVQQKLARIGALVHDTAIRKFGNFTDSIAPSIRNFRSDAEAVSEFVGMRTWYERQTNGMKLMGSGDNLRLQVKGLPKDTALIHGENIFNITNANTARFIKSWSTAHRAVSVDKLAVRAGRQAATPFKADDFFLPSTPIRFGAILFRKNAIGGNARGGMLRANSSQQLKELTAELKRGGEYDVVPINKVEQYYEALGQYDIDQSFGSSAISSQMEKKGLAASVVPNLDPDFHLQDLQSYTFNQIKANVRGAVSLNYSKEFQTLDVLHEATIAAGSGKKGAKEELESQFSRAKRAALDIRQDTQLKTFDVANEGLEKYGSRMYNSTKQFFTKQSKDMDWEGLNKHLEDQGLPKAYDGVDMALLASQKDIDSPVVQQFVAKANGVLATLLLRFMETADAAVNTLSYAIMAAPEVKAIMKQVELEQKGTLESMLTIGNKEGSFKEISAIKSFLNAQKRYLSPEGKVEMQAWKELGLLKDQDTLLRDLTDQSIFTGQESAKELTKKSKLIDGSVEKLKKGGFFIADAVSNRLQYATVRLARDIADTAKLSDVEFEVLAHTLKGRVLAMNIPNQKPTIFQGAIGTSISLFQNYQLNIWSAIGRHIGNKDKRALMTMTGLQGGLFGLQGLPGYAQINAAVHDLHTKSGNDVNSILEGSFGEESLWMLYGSASNALNTALYTRGDLNPRNQFILPTSPSEIPTIRAITKVASEAGEFVSNLKNGAPVGASILDAIAHSNLNRPITNLIDASRGYATSEEGSYLYDIDTSLKSAEELTLENAKFDMANVLRYTGARPFDEALLREKNFTYTSYNADTQKSLANISRAIKLTIVSEGEITQAQVDDFALKFVKTGKSAADFDKWFSRITRGAKRDMVEKLAKRLRKSPYMESYSRFLE